MKKYIGLLFTSLMLAACGESVQVPPAHLGKVLTKNGYAPETITPSKFRLPQCLAYCDELVLLEASDTGLKEQMQVFMPKDRLNLAVDIRGTYSIPIDKKTVTALFDRVPAAREPNSPHKMITALRVYNTYGRQAIRGIVRSEITKYTIQDILENREAIGNNIHAAIASKLAESDTPLVLTRFELANVQPPEVIVKAQEAAKEREIDIQKAEADAEVKMTEAELALEVAKKNRLVEREKAEAIAEQNRIAAKSITPEVLAYKQLETALAIVEAAAQGGNTIFLPTALSGADAAGMTDAAVLAKLLGRELKQ